MLPNRSIPSCTVIPEIGSADVGEAATWLCDVFGFNVRLRIGNHRVQLNVGDGAVVLTENHDSSSSIMIRVEDVDRHHAHASERGADIVRPPTTYPFGERQYTARDPSGNVWTFSQSVADVAPEEWGGMAVNLSGPLPKEDLLV